MHPAHLVRETEVATRVASELNALSRRWAEVEIRFGRVYVHAGDTTPDGERERALYSHTFYSDVSGNVRFETTVHS